MVLLAKDTRGALLYNLCLQLFSGFAKLKKHKKEGGEGGREAAETHELPGLQIPPLCFLLQKKPLTARQTLSCLLILASVSSSPRNILPRTFILALFKFLLPWGSNADALFFFKGEKTLHFGAGKYIYIF